MFNRKGFGLVFLVAAGAVIITVTTTFAIGAMQNTDNASDVERALIEELTIAKHELTKQLDETIIRINWDYSLLTDDEVKLLEYYTAIDEALSILWSGQLGESCSSRCKHECSGLNVASCALNCVHGHGCYPSCCGCKDGSTMCKDCGASCVSDEEIDLETILKE